MQSCDALSLIELLFQDRIYDTPHGFQDLILTVLQKVCDYSGVMLINFVFLKINIKLFL